MNDLGYSGNTALMKIHSIDLFQLHREENWLLLRAEQSTSSSGPVNIHNWIMTNKCAQQYIHYLITTSETIISIIIIYIALVVFTAYVVIKWYNADQPLEANDQPCNTLHRQQGLFPIHGIQLYMLYTLHDIIMLIIITADIEEGCNTHLVLPQMFAGVFVNSGKT